MASAYYKMAEVMEKLGKTEQEVHDLIKQGKLRQYMDAGKPVFKVDEVEKLKEDIVGLELPGGSASEIELKLDETDEITLLPDEDNQPQKEKGKESEGGFGLSQLGDLTKADTAVGTVGLNLLSGTEDAYKLSEDTKAETRVGQTEEEEPLGGDANLESFGSGSGLLDLSLQADDTSLGAVLDDILPTAAEAPAAAGAAAAAAEPVAEEPLAEAAAEEPLGAAEKMPLETAAAGVPAAVMPMVIEDPTSGIYGVMMFLPVLALAVAAAILSAALLDVRPAILRWLTEVAPADIPLVWYLVGALSLASLLFWAYAAMGSSGAKSKPAKDVYEKKPKPKKK